MNNLWNDDLTQSIASTVSDVLEGKIKVEEMNPKDHVKQNKDGGYDVFDGKGNVAKTFGKKEEAEGYAIKNHDALMAAGKEVDEVAEPEAKGEKEFKAKHKVKKSGDKEDGTNMKEEITISIDYMHKIDEKLKPGKGKETIDVDYIGDKGLTKKLESKFKVKIKQTGSTTADITGEKKNILSFMKSDAYMMDDGDIEELFPELLESVSPEMADELPAAGKETGYMGEDEHDLSPAQKKYQAFFKKALKKFGAESPADLDDEKKKEFFNYIDKNYKSVDESITERFKAKPPMAGMHLTGFEGKLKLNQQSGHEDNHSDAVIKDFKAAVKIVDKHLKKLGMKSVPEVFVGPKDVAKEKGVKVGAFASDFAISVYPGFRDGPKLPSGKKDSEINLDPMVAELGKLKSFVNFPRSDWSDNWDK
jgi:hypothetical protein